MIIEWEREFEKIGVRDLFDHLEESTGSYYFEKYSLQEIVQILQIPEGNIPISWTGAKRISLSEKIPGSKKIFTAPDRTRVQLDRLELVPSMSRVLVKTFRGKAGHVRWNTRLWMIKGKS